MLRYLFNSLNAKRLGARKPLARRLQQQRLGCIVQAFSLLAIATSFIGFVLGLSDFLADYLKARPKCTERRLPGRDRVSIDIACSTANSFLQPTLFSNNAGFCIPVTHRAVSRTTSKTHRPSWPCVLMSIFACSCQPGGSRCCPTRSRWARRCCWRCRSRTCSSARSTLPGPTGVLYFAQPMT